MWIWNELSAAGESGHTGDRPAMEWREISPRVTLYELLGLSSTASAEEITKRYRELARKHHPDARPDSMEAANATMATLNATFDVLRNPTRRAAYDREHGLRR